MSDGQDFRESSARHLVERSARRADVATHVERSARRADVANHDEGRGVAANDDVVSSSDCTPPLRGSSDIERKPLHYKVICISMYTEDLARLDRMVEALKSRGLTRANRSALIRHALSAVDLDRVPKGF